MEDFKSQGVLAKTTKKIHRYTYVFETLFVLMEVYQYYIFVYPIDYDPEVDLVWLDGLFLFSSIVLFVLTILAMVYFFRRLYRIIKNLRKLHGVRTLKSAGWSIVRFFVPIANLYKGYQIVSDVFEKTVDDIQGGFLSLWWLLWLASGVMGQILRRMDIDSEVYMMVSILTSIVSIGSLYMTWKLIDRVSKGYENKFGDK